MEVSLRQEQDPLEAESRVMREPHMTKTMLSRNLSCCEQEVINEITIAKKRDER
jgi:hypothetical protein